MYQKAMQVNMLAIIDLHLKEQAGGKVEAGGNREAGAGQTPRAMSG